MHELVFAQAVEPNREANVERLEGARTSLSIMPHAEVPVHAARDEVHPHLVNPAFPLLAVFTHEGAHLVLLTGVNTRDA